MITLITGTPGSGKTAQVVSMMMDEYKDRPTFVYGIKELDLPHHKPAPVAEWVLEKPSEDDPTVKAWHFDFPPNSVLIIDECQNLYRPRGSAAKVPPIVSALETHRHEGMDIVLLTQGIHLIDTNVSALVTRHMHIRSNLLGKYIYEWKEAVQTKNLSRTSIDNSVKRRFQPPKKAFTHYKSAEVHTKVKFKGSYIFLFLFFILCLLGYLFYDSYNIVSGKRGAEADDSSTIFEPSVPIPSNGSSSSGFSPDDVENMTYIESHKPEIKGLDFTAPVYRESITPTQVPYPAACYSSRSKGCRCFTQQATPISMDDSLCRQIVDNGIFLDFKPLYQDTTRVGNNRVIRGDAPNADAL